METFVAIFHAYDTEGKDLGTVRVEHPFPEGTPITEVVDDMEEMAWGTFEARTSEEVDYVEEIGLSSE